MLKKDVMSIMVLLKSAAISSLMLASLVMGIHIGVNKDNLASGDIFYTKKIGFVSISDIYGWTSGETLFAAGVFLLLALCLWLTAKYILPKLQFPS